MLKKLLSEKWRHQMRKHIFLVMAILFMMISAMAMATSVSPTANNNGNAFTAASATINVDTANLDTFSADYSAGIWTVIGSNGAKNDAGQNTTYTNIASTANKADGTDNVDGANMVISMNSDAAINNGTFMIIIALVSPTGNSDRSDRAQVSNVAANGAATDANICNEETVALVLKVPIGAGVYFKSKGLDTGVATTVDLTGSLAATLKKPTDVSANNTGALALTFIANTELNQTANLMNLNAASGIIHQSIANSALVSFSYIIAGLAQNLEVVAYANDLVGNGAVRTILLDNTIADTAIEKILLEAASRFPGLSISIGAAGLSLNAMA